MKLSEAGLALLKGICIICILGAIIGVFVTSSPFAYLAGIGIGAVISLLKLVLLEIAVSQVMELEAKEAKSAMRRSYMFRYLVTGVGVFVAIHFLGIPGFAGVAVGLLSMNFSAYVSHFLMKKQPKIENVNKINEINEVEKEG